MSFYRIGKHQLRSIGMAWTYQLSLRRTPCSFDQLLDKLYVCENLLDLLERHQDTAVEVGDLDRQQEQLLRHRVHLDMICISREWQMVTVEHI